MGAQDVVAVDQAEVALQCPGRTRQGEQVGGGVAQRETEHLVAGGQDSEGYKIENDVQYGRGGVDQCRAAGVAQGVQGADLDLEGGEGHQAEGERGQDQSQV